MNTSQHEFTELQRPDTCTEPAIQEQLFDYIAELLSDQAAEDVEDHLLDCQHCREFFLVMLSIRGEARRSRILRGGEDDGAPDSARVVRLADFRQAKTAKQTSSPEAKVGGCRVRPKR